MSASETEKAILRQSEVLGQDWAGKFDAHHRRQLRSAKSIQFVGLGTSYHCALWAHWLCLVESAGKLKSQPILTWDQLFAGSLEKTGRRPRNELLVAISHRGSSGLTQWLLSGEKRSKRLLVCGAQAPTGGHPAIGASPMEISQAHTMSLFGAIGATSEIVAQLLPKTQGDRLRAERGLTAELLASWQNLEASESSVLRKSFVGAPGAGLAFVGGGPFYAIALELALKAMEIAYLPARAFQTEAFLHGPLASVDREDLIVPLSPFGKLASAPQHKLASDRLKKGADASLAIGARVQTLELPAALRKGAQSLGPCWQALLWLYWGQWFCLNTAKTRGLNPDLNRRNEPRYEEARRLIEL